MGEAGLEAKPEGLHPSWADMTRGWDLAVRSPAARSAHLGLAYVGGNQSLVGPTQGPAVAILGGACPGGSEGARCPVARPVPLCGR